MGCRFRECEGEALAYPFLCVEHVEEMRAHFQGERTSWETGTVITYVLEGHGYLKVGYTRDLDHRIKSLSRPGNDTRRPKSLLGTQLTLTPVVTMVGHMERELQARLVEAGAEREGEWFVDTPVAREVVADFFGLEAA